MKPGTKIIVERIRNGNRSARRKIARKDFADLFADLSAFGADRLLDAIGEELAPPRRGRPTPRPKGDFESLADTVKARTRLDTRGILDRMYRELQTSLGDDMPAKSKVRSMPKFLGYFEPKLGEQQLCQTLSKIVRRDFPAH